MKGYVYILKDKKEHFYIGSTSNMKRRMQQHISGHTQTTRKMKGPVPVLVQEYENISIARKIERKLKMLKRKDYIEKIILEGYIKMAV